MTLLDAFLLVVTGLLTGFINTLAGGGSLLVMPLLIFMGIPSIEANGTNRVAIFIQSIFAVIGFRSKGVSVLPFALYIAAPAVIGSIFGTYIAVDLKDAFFNKILAITMLIVLPVTFLKPRIAQASTDKTSNKKIFLSCLIFFFVGMYGGFIHAGIGFFIIASLTAVHGFDMARTNGIKVFVALCYTLASVIVFVLNDKVKWDYALVLASGNAVGAYVGSRWSVGKSDNYIKLIMIVMVGFLSIKLWFF